MRKTPYFLFGLVYFIQGALGITGVALPLFLRDVFGLRIVEITTLTSIAALPWILKPFLGLLSDLVPIHNLRRKPYLVMSSALAFASWLGIAFAPDHSWFFIGLFFANLGVAGMDVFVDGYAVQVSTKHTRGKIQALCWGARSAGAVLVGVLGGVLAQQLGYRPVFLIAALLPFVTLLATARAHELPSSKQFHFGTIIKGLLDKRIWIAIFFLFVWNVAPNIGTPFFFYLRDQLNLSEVLLGTVRSASSIGAVLGAIIFAKLLDHIKLSTLLYTTIIATSISTFLLFSINSATSALVIYALLGTIGYIAFIPVMKFAAAITPQGGEATIFAVLMGIMNLGGIISTYAGGILFDAYGLNVLIVLSALVILLPLPFVRFLHKV